MATTRSFCRICTSLCGIVVEHEGDTITRVGGDREHPLSRGYSCPKGRALDRMHHHPQRIEYPELNGKRSDWHTALDDLAGRLQAIIEQHGPAAVGIYFGSGLGMDAAGYKMAEKLHATLGTPAKFSPLTIDGTAKVAVSSLMAHFPGFNARPDYDNARLLLLIGVNPVVSHGHATAIPLPPPSTLKAVRTRGQVWVIDPRRSESCDFASHHIAVKPGVDYAILGFLLRELLAEALPPDVERKVQQRDTLRQAVAPFDAEHAAQLAGISVEELLALRDARQHYGRVAIDTGTGVTMSKNANLTQWFAWALMLLTDSINRPGGVWFHPGFITPLDAAPLPEIPPEMLFAPGPPSRPELQGFLGEWPGAALTDEIEAGNIRAFINLGGNLLTAFPDAHRLRPALQKLEVCASLEIIRNETTACSTHVLPTKDQMERADITLWDILSSRVSAQYTQAVIPPTGERRSSWWILAQLIHRLGGDPGVSADFSDSADHDEQMLAIAMANARCSFDQLKGSGYVETQHSLPAAWVDNFIDTVGGWRLAPEPFSEQLKALADSDATELTLIPRRQKRHVNAQMVYLGDQPDILLNNTDAQARNIHNGDKVIVSNTSGSLTGIALVSDAIRAGTVSVPHGFEHANVNRLTDGSVADTLTGMAWYSGLSVQVSRYP